MAYFDGVKVGDRVWSIEFGWGEVNIVDNSKEILYISFDSLSDEKKIGNTVQYNFNGFRFIEQSLLKLAKNQTLFWDEVEIEPPRRPQIELKNDYVKIINEGVINSKVEIDFNSYKQLKKYARLLALRDEECQDSKGYEFIEGRTNFYIYKMHNRFAYIYSEYIYAPYVVYFKTEEDAQKICNILNSERFKL